MRLPALPDTGNRVPALAAPVAVVGSAPRAATQENASGQGFSCSGPSRSPCFSRQPAAQRRDSASGLRATEARLSRQAQSALLELYSLEAQLARARARVATIERRQASLEREAEIMRRNLVGVTRSRDDAQLQLQQQLRRLYEQPSPDPLAVVLGAQSLDEAFTSFDNLRARRTAEHHDRPRDAGDARRGCSG